MGNQGCKREMRVLGLVAEDEQMTQDFLDGEDMHTNTAAMVWNLPPEEVSVDLRKNAKATNFGEKLRRLVA